MGANDTDAAPPATGRLATGKVTTGGPADRLLGIGAFARRSRLSMKALRLYDRLGLLPPAAVDASTGYRRYRESQVSTARLIVLLRRLEMPLAQVRQVVSVPADRAAELVASYWQAVERRVAGQRELAAHIRSTLSGGSGYAEQFDIQQRAVPERLVLTEQRHVFIDELEPWTRAAGARLMASAQRDGTVTGQLFRIFRGEVTEDSDGPVEVCLPIGAVANPATAGAAMRREPAHREIYTRLTSAQYEYPQVLSAYHALERRIEQQRLRCLAPPREILLRDLDLPRAAPGEHVCDVAFPVE